MVRTAREDAPASRSGAGAFRSRGRSTDHSAALEVREAVVHGVDGEAGSLGVGPPVALHVAVDGLGGLGVGHTARHQVDGLVRLGLGEVRSVRHAHSQHYSRPRVNTIVDLFCGAGGWGHGARLAGIPDPIGIELDASACIAHQRAGLPTIRADITTYPVPPLDGLIASPPCQPFSAAGQRHGIAVIDDVLAHIASCADGWHDTDAAWRADPKIGLIVEPLRWALLGAPTWTAWEQVPSVLPIWEACAEVLQAHGWHVWTGILSAEEYGTPQTRKRAILTAHREHRVARPAPTHQPYRKGVARWTEAQTPDLFSGPLEPWGSMADALGWSDEWDVRYQRGAGMTERHGERPARSCADPAPTLTGSALGAGAGAKMTLHTNRGQDEHGVRQTRSTEAPAPALSTKSGGQWTFDRPATAIMGDARVWEPGHKVNADDARRLGPEEAARRYGDRAGTTAIRITEQDALILQGFPADWPLHGTRTAKFRQVGNAIPPPLAAAVLRSLGAA